MAASRPASGDDSPRLHEPIPNDPRDDIAMGVVLEGDIPAAIQTRSGVFSAPDPSRPPTQGELSATQHAADHAFAGGGDPVGDTYTPDRDTRRPDIVPYFSDPFTPSTMPYKRLVAFDAVDSHFALYSFGSRLMPFSVTHVDARAGEDVFYADIPVDLAPDKHTRIPSVGPGARVLHAHLGVGPRELPILLERDVADNWFIDGSEATSARLVMEVAIPRAAFGGDFGDPSWSALSPPPVPENVASAAREVAAHIGVSRSLSPAEDVRRLVAYFRAFVDSDAPLSPSRDVYTDLATSQKGVCRHRAYAFTITALALGIPTRMVMNEAHAWVEVYSGTIWKRIDLGGAGRLVAEPDEKSRVEPYVAPTDAFPWPPNATRGDDLTGRSAANAGAGGNGNGGAGAGAGSSSPAASASAGAAEPQDTGDRSSPGDKRPASHVTLQLQETDAQRGSPVHVSGVVTAEGDACQGVVVVVLLHDPKTNREARIGTVATDEHGAYSAPIVLPPAVPLGDYEVVAQTEGDGRCGRGSAQ
ncbi:MAG TPA: transglutaminase domain-containing protein [Polyangiaceae bacterium]|nr:transglutaminase domain-containing protein [Polyangiaceae bacterium]